MERNRVRSTPVSSSNRERTRMRSILHYNGLPIPASYVVDGVAAVIAPARPTAQRVV